MSTPFCPIHSAVSTTLHFLFGSSFNSWACISVPPEGLTEKFSLGLIFIASGSWEDKKTWALLHVQPLGQMEKSVNYSVMKWIPGRGSNGWLLDPACYPSCGLCMSHPWGNLYKMHSNTINQGAGDSAPAPHNLQLLTEGSTGTLKIPLFM